MQKPLKGYWVSHCKPAIFNDLMNISSKVNTILYFSFSDMTTHITKPLPLECTPMVRPSQSLKYIEPPLLGQAEYNKYTPMVGLSRSKKDIEPPLHGQAEYISQKHFNIGEKVKPTETPISRSSSREALSNSFDLTREKMKLPFFRPDHQITPQACRMNEQKGASSKAVFSGN